MNTRRFFVPLWLLLTLVGIGCTPKVEAPPEKLTIGVVSYGEGGVSLDKYDRFKEYIAQQTSSVVELEPAYNELQAVEQIQQHNWDLVFAPPGIVAIATGKQQYVPLFPLATINSTERALLVVRQDSPIRTLNDLSNRVLGLGEVGSAAGYYLPLYDLYGLTLSQIQFAPTPRTMLEWLSQGKIDAGALSEKDYQQYQFEFRDTPFRILHVSRRIPDGAVLLSPNVDHARQEEIRSAMNAAPSDIASDAGYLPSSQPIDYKNFVELVNKVKPLESRVRQKPAVLTMEAPAATEQAPQTPASP